MLDKEKIIDGLTYICAEMPLRMEHLILLLNTITEGFYDIKEEVFTKKIEIEGNVDCRIFIGGKWRTFDITNQLCQTSEKERFSLLTKEIKECFSELKKVLEKESSSNSCEVRKSIQKQLDNLNELSINISEYKIIYGDHDIISEKINEEIKKGYFVFGNHSVCRGTFAQVMVKYNYYDFNNYKQYGCKKHLNEKYSSIFANFTCECKCEKCKEKTND